MSAHMDELKLAKSLGELVGELTALRSQVVDIRKERDDWKNACMEAMRANLKFAAGGPR